ncbi:MAG TPA: ABC transporter permease [Blastocatellia bacterium]|jgi:ABC-2 type transport system permease protein|nr:ABC transporter permease [Blastocatellia bacterium]
MKKVWVIVKREYLVRIRSRAFLIGTILSPVFLLGLIILPGMLAERASGGRRQIVVLDQSADPQLFETIKDRVESHGSAASLDREDRPGRAVSFTLVRQTLTPDQDPNEFIKEDSNADAEKGSDKAYLILSPRVVDGVEPEYHAKNLSDFSIRSLEESVSAAISERRLMNAGFDANKIGKYMKPVDLKMFKIGARGESKAGGVRQEFMVAFALLFFLYISVLFYGIFMMRGVIEEKQSRVVEILISSVKPTQMMLGKLIGIGLVGLTQIGIWALSAALISRVGSRMLVSSGVSSVPNIPVSLLIYFVLFFILGFFLYATLYAIVGATVSSEEDAQQAQFPVTMLIVVPMMIFGVVMSNPNSTSSIVLSMIPFFAPTLMMLRIAVINPPVWQVALSMLIMLVTTLGLLWVAAKIYRVGILMYGKRPSIAELGRWLRYT